MNLARVCLASISVCLLLACVTKEPKKDPPHVVSAEYPPSLNLGGGPQYVYGALPTGNIAPGKTGQVLETKADAAVWVDASGGGGTTVHGVDGGGVVVDGSAVYSTRPCAVVTFQPVGTDGDSPEADASVGNSCVCTTDTCVSNLLNSGNGSVDVIVDTVLGTANVHNGVTWDFHLRGTLYLSSGDLNLLDGAQIKNVQHVRGTGSRNASPNVFWYATSTTGVHPFDFSANYWNGTKIPGVTLWFDNANLGPSTSAALTAIQVPNTAHGLRSFTFIVTGSAQILTTVGSSAPGTIGLTSGGPDAGSETGGWCTLVAYDNTLWQTGASYTPTLFTTPDNTSTVTQYVDGTELPLPTPQNAYLDVGSRVFDGTFTTTSCTSPLTCSVSRSGSGTTLTASIAAGGVAIDAGTKNPLPLARLQTGGTEFQEIVVGDAGLPIYGKLNLTSSAAVTPGTPDGGCYRTNGTTNYFSACPGTGTVTSVTGTAPISVATGTTTPVVSLAPTGTGLITATSGAANAAALNGTAGQLCVASTAPAPAFVTGAGDLTWSTGTPGSATVTQVQAGEYLFGASTGLETVATGASAPGVTLANPASNVTAPNFNFTSATPFNGTGASAANNTPASWVFNVPAPGTTTNAGAEAAISFQRGGANYWRLQALVGSATTNAALYPWTATPSASNYVLQSDGTSTTLNAPSATGTVRVDNAASTLTIWRPSGPQETDFLGNVQIGGVGGGTYGTSGTNEIYFTNGTAPTTACTGGSCLQSTTLGLATTSAAGDRDVIAAPTAIVGSDYSLKVHTGPHCEFSTVGTASGSCILTLPWQSTYGSSIQFDALEQAKCVVAGTVTPCTIGAGSTPPDVYVTAIYGQCGNLSPTGTFGSLATGCNPTAVTGFNTSMSTASCSLVGSTSGQATITCSMSGAGTGTTVMWVGEIKKASIQ